MYIKKAQLMLGLLKWKFFLSFALITIDFFILRATIGIELFKKLPGDFRILF